MKDKFKRVNWFATVAFLLVLVAIVSAIYRDNLALTLALGLGSITCVLLAERED